MTADLLKLSDWLLTETVPVAMESANTGKVFNILAANFEVMLVSNISKPYQDGRQT